MHIRLCSVLAAALLFFSSLAVAVWAQNHGSQIGREVSIPRHLQDGEEFELSIPKLIAFGEKLFRANWTHSLASHLVAGNDNLALVKQALGHRSINSTMQYVGTTDAQAAEAVQTALMGLF